MGGPKPWPTRWPEPARIPLDPDKFEEPLADPDYEIEESPREEPARLPENQLEPYSVTWGVTHPCNLRCPHCYDVSDTPRTDLSTEESLAVIDRLDDIGINFVVFSGGEPLLRRDLFTLMEYCRKRNLEIGMRSNGTLITSKVAQRLAELELSVAGISLDGASAQSHDQIRGEGSFQRAIAGIKQLTAANIRVNIEVVLSRLNAHEALACVKLAEALDVDEINFSALAPQGRGQELGQAILDYDLWQKLTTTLYQASLTANVSVSPSCALTGACWACVEPNITSDGWVTPRYLSNQRLFHILETPPEKVKSRLKQQRATTLENCGRTLWTKGAIPFMLPENYYFVRCKNEIICFPHST
jgi:MoaA/NifB/PqqE/SkfB family radical SAM enzyme